MPAPPLDGIAPVQLTIGRTRALLEFVNQAFQIRNKGAGATEPSGAVLNAVAILESFEGQYTEQTLSQISRRLAIPKATALRNLAALEQNGYVIRNRPKSTYSLGPKVLELARRFVEQNELLSIARPILADLAAETGETAHLGILAGSDVTYLEIAESPQLVRACVARGDRLPAHCVASGKAILAYCDADQVKGVIAGGLKPLSSHTITSPRDFEDELAATRERGFGLNLGEWLDDVVAVSAPVFSHLGEVIAAVGIAAPKSRLDSAKACALGSRIRAHANRLSSRLGAPANCVTDITVKCKEN